MGGWQYGMFWYFSALSPHSFLPPGLSLDASARFLIS